MENAEASYGETKQEQHGIVAYGESLMNLALYDPPRWGWTAVGTIADLLPPHERSRRRSTAVAYRKLKRKRAPATSRSEKTAPPTLFQDSQEGSSAITAQSNDGTAAAAVDISSGRESPLNETASPALIENVANLRSVDTNKASSEATTVERKNPPNTELTPPHAEDSKDSQPDDSGKEIMPEQKQPQQEDQVVDVMDIDEVNPQLMGNVQSQKGPNLPTLKLLGVKSKYLGMNVIKVSPTEGGTSKKSDSKSANNGRSTYECSVAAFGSDGVLDMYSYHRGREGLEPRDPESGELRFPLPVSDTNHNYDAPRLCCNVTIEFRLNDNDDPEEEVSSYNETITWDLSDPTTPSPITFAHGIANEFGLHYGQMLDLALNIESQIDMYLQQNISYFPPLSAEDPTGSERQSAGPSIQTHRYGQVIQLVPGGTRLASKERQRLAQSSRSTPKPQSSTTASTSGKRRETIRVFSDEYDDDIEEKYLEEIQRRSREESKIEVAKKCTNGIVGLLEAGTNLLCHICHKRCPLVYSFGCGLTSHAYCELHCKTRLESENFNPDQPILHYCPVCCLYCKCSRCVRKLKTVAGSFKAAMQSQGTTIEDTRYDNVLLKCRSVAGNIKLNGPIGGVKRRSLDGTPETQDAPSKSIPKSTTAKSSQNRPHKRQTGNLEPSGEGSPLLVPKPPLSEFPREIHGSLELEPGTPEDYLRVFTSQGSYLANDFPEVWLEQRDYKADSDLASASNGELVEDGNVDFCHVCQNHGNLVCCDYCPRAFHIDCLDEAGNSVSAERWECTTCKREKEEMPEDLVDTKLSQEWISSLLAKGNYQIDETSQKQVEALSAIHAMLLRLIDYDFGYMFSVPVDVENVPGYKQTVENPMDLGTIRDKIVNGGYMEILSKTGSWDKVLVAVLQDVELVWHNCFLFNFEGSAIYRMATVQRRRALAIQQRSFDHLLGDLVKTEVQDYVNSCEDMRGQLTTAGPAAIAGNKKERELRARKPKGKHKITVKVAKPSVNRAVAIFDHVSGRVVKIYSSIKNASHAVHSLISLGHRCEFPFTQDLVKQVTTRSATDPSVLLFGYRWLMLDDLRDGKVVIHDPPIEGIQLKYFGSVYTFLSLDEAMCFPYINRDMTFEGLRSQLSTLPRSYEWKEIGGVQWRCLPGSRDKHKASEPPREIEIPQESSVAAILPEARNEESQPTVEEFFLAHSTVIKEDLITKRKMVGFGSVDDAFTDWLQSAELSPFFPQLEARTQENFKTYYLDGDRNIDGMAWKTCQVAHQESLIGQKNGFQQPNSNINGLAGPVVRPDTKKRSRELGLPSNTSDDEGDTKRKRAEDLCNSTERPNNVSAPANPNTPLPAVQLFRRSPDIQLAKMCQNGEVARSPSDVAAATS